MRLSLKQLPPHIQERLSQTNPELFETRPKRKARPANKAKMAGRDSGFGVWLASTRAQMMDADDCTETQLWLPGLVLGSANDALRGSERGNRIKLAGILGREVRDSLRRASLGNTFRHTLPVNIAIWQFGSERKIDAGNLWHKPLIDALTDHAHGLGVIRDDSPKYVENVIVGYPPKHADARGLGVMVFITHVSQDQ